MQDKRMKYWMPFKERTDIHICFVSKRTFMLVILSILLSCKSWFRQETIKTRNPVIGQIRGHSIKLTSMIRNPLVEFTINGTRLRGRGNLAPA